MSRVRDLQVEGRRFLSGRVPASPGREASRLLAHLLESTEAALATFDEREVDPEIAARFRELLERRAAGEPAAYLTGAREFFGRSFEVDARVLVPRPETEHLVEIALGLPLPKRARVLDVGVGSGAVAVTLAAERPDWRVTGTDLALDALAVARRNGSRLAPDARLDFVAADLVAPLRLRSFDLVVSNPPYVDPDDVEAIAPEVRDHEPALALFARRGTTILRALTAAGGDLAPGAHLVLEIGAGQAAEVVERARRSALYDRVEVLPDLAGIDRNVVLRRRA